MSRADHCFLVILADGRSGFAFCTAKEFDLEAARAHVNRVLAEMVDGFEVPYLGLLDYRDMDPEIGDHLHLFEKHDPVWLLLPARPAGER